MNEQAVQLATVYYDTPFHVSDKAWSARNQPVVGISKANHHIHELKAFKSTKFLDKQFAICRPPHHLQFYLQLLPRSSKHHYHAKVDIS